jgi:hypothetical protein
MSRRTDCGKRRQMELDSRTMQARNRIARQRRSSDLQSHPDRTRSPESFLRRISHSRYEMTSEQYGALSADDIHLEQSCRNTSNSCRRVNQNRIPHKQRRALHLSIDPGQRRNERIEMLFDSVCLDLCPLDHRILGGRHQVYLFRPLAPLGQSLYSPPVDTSVPSSPLYG